MQTKQYSVQVCEVSLTDENKFISFFDTNYNFFKNHLILINGEVTKKVEDYLNGKGLRFIVNITLPKKQSSKKVNKELDNEKQKLIDTQKKLEAKILELINSESNDLKVLDTLVRSGQELKIDGDLLLLNRVNSGANIIVDGNLIITQIVDGSIRCYGKFMMLKASPKANIIFHDVEVDNSFLKDRLNRVELKNDEILITPVLKETNWGV
ncbi:MAG: septum site-determining protein MinC [Campylobacterota bacterium]|nr:septum site-determining protein MinC [Campylobacterota bacterium]